MALNRRFFLSFLLVSTLLIPCIGFPAPATPPLMNEIWVHQGSLSSRDVANWSRIPGERGYLFKTLQATRQDVKALLDLSRATSLTIEAEALPDSADAELWAALARKFPSLKLTFVDVQLPTQDQLDTLNRVAAASITFILTYFPDLDESARLGQLAASSVSIEFQTAFYPRHEERDLLLAIPARIPLTFVSSLWPWYHQMDVFNMLPHLKNLRIQDGGYPSGAQWDYYQNIHELQETSIVSDFPPPDAGIWERFGDQKIAWVYRLGVPEERDLKLFEASAQAPGSRRLVLETEGTLSPGDLARMKSLKIPVEWKHPADR